MVDPTGSKPELHWKRAVDPIVLCPTETSPFKGFARAGHIIAGFEKKEQLG